MQAVAKLGSNTRRDVSPKAHYARGDIRGRASALAKIRPKLPDLTPEPSHAIAHSRVIATNTRHAGGKIEGAPTRAVSEQSSPVQPRVRAHANDGSPRH